MHSFGTPQFGEMSGPSTSSWKRSREDTVALSSSTAPGAVIARRRRCRASDAATTEAEAAEWVPNPFQTPLRRESMESNHPFDAPPPRCRSPSTAVSEMDGLTSSESSIHLLELGLAAHATCLSSSSTGYVEDQGDMSPAFRCGPAPAVVLADGDAQQWQRELTQFFARLDQRPLCVVPLSREPHPSNE